MVGEETKAGLGEFQAQLKATMQVNRLGFETAHRLKRKDRARPTCLGEYSSSVCFVTLPTQGSLATVHWRKERNNLGALSFSQALAWAPDSTEAQNQYPALPQMHCDLSKSLDCFVPQFFICRMEFITVCSPLGY